MKFTAIVAIPALIASVAAAPVEERSDLETRTTCHMKWTGSNSEGGGGPGQAPINNNAFNVEVTGKKKFQSAEKQTGANGVIDVKLTKAQWGGDHALNMHAQWNYGGNSWYRCSASKNGHTYKGKVEKQKIHTGTVSVTTDVCHVDFPCA